MVEECCIPIPETIAKQVESKGGLDAIVRSIPEKSVLEARSMVHGALSDPARLMILNILARQPLCVCLIKKVVDMPDSKLSYHLGVLRDAGLIVGKREGNWIIYETTEAGLACV